MPSRRISAPISPGRVLVEAAPKSLAERVAQAALARWWREAGW